MSDKAHDEMWDELVAERDQYRKALENLYNKVTDIRGIDIELYARTECEAAKQALEPQKDKP